MTREAGSTQKKEMPPLVRRKGILRIESKHGHNLADVDRGKARKVTLCLFMELSQQEHLGEGRAHRSPICECPGRSEAVSHDQDAGMLVRGRREL